MKRVIVALLLVLILTLALPARPVLAIPIVTVSPIQGEPGARIYVTGSGYTANLNFTVYFARGTAAEIQRSGIVSSSGTIFDTFPVPDIPAGVYIVAAETSWTETGSATFTVVPVIRFDKALGYVGTVVTASGAGFKAGSPVGLNFDNTPVAAPVTGGNGGFSGVTFTIPEGTRGQHLMTATDSENHQATGTIAVLHSITVSPGSGPTGTKVAIKGTGFKGRTPMVITFDGAAAATEPGTVVTSELGSFNATLTVPASPRRVHDIVVSDEANISTATFTSVGTISITPTAGNVGTQVTVKGSGFAGGRAVTIRLDAAQVTTTTVDPSGAFTISFNLPASPTGEHTVTASDGTDSAIARFSTTGSMSISQTRGPAGMEVKVTGTGLAASRPVGISFADSLVRSATTDADGNLTDGFTVPRVPSGNYPVRVTDGVNTLNATFTTVPSATFSPTIGNIGSSLTISGTGFAGTVTVRWDNTVAGTAMADASGAFFVTFSVPASVRGNHVIAISDGVNSFQSNFTVESTPPQPPVLTLPARDSDAKGDIKFDWSDVTDPSMPVTYVLQVATSRDFSPAATVLERKGLTVSEYALSKDEALKPARQDAPYYWRARAVDAASNESDWSSVSSFYISAFPDWAKYGLIGLGVLILALFVFWLGRRTSRPI